MAAISFREGRRAEQMPGRVSRVRGPQRCPEIAAAAGQPLPSRALTSQNTQPLKHPGIAPTQRIKPLPPPPQNQYATIKPWTSHPYKDFQVNVHSSFIYKSQKPKATQMPFNRRVDKEITVEGHTRH